MSEVMETRSGVSGNETDRLETMLTAVSGMCQQLTTLQRAVIEGNVNAVQLSDILVDQARALEQALQQYRVTVDTCFKDVTQKTITSIHNELQRQLDQEAASAIKNHVTPQIEYFIQQQEERLAILESSARETRELIQVIGKRKYGWKLFFASLLLVVLTGALSALLVTTILLPQKVMRMDEIRLAALSAGSVLVEAWPKLSEQEKNDINQTLQKANNKTLGKMVPPTGP